MADLLSPNLAIGASAGSGKTFALAHRYIGLLLRGAPPEKIVALTFSRKAAGEILDAIVGYLIRAASCERTAREVGERVGQELDRRRAAGLLRLLLGRLHRLQTGTLDSFAGRVLRSFPLELGAGAECRILDSNEADHRLVLLAALRRYLAELAPATRAAFFTAFRRASFGDAPRTFTDTLLAFVEACHGLYLDHPDAACWGFGDHLWPRPPGWRSAPPPTAEQCQRFLDLVRGLDLPDKVDNAFARFCQALLEWSPAVAPDQGLAYILDRLPDDTLVASRGILRLHRRKVELDGEAWALLQGFVGWMLGREVAAQDERLRAIHAIMAGYEEVYDRYVRRQGLLTFDDVHRLVRAGLRRGGMAERIAFRLDARFDHWLLDEFQDTSRLQWQALQPLADECIQDPGRTFFYVGDVKQAIYAWRRGDARIFGEILDHYGSFDRLDLDVSHRSVRPVVEAVNQVFGGVAGMDGLPGEAVRRWQEEWRPHRSALDPAEGGGVLLLEVACRSSGRGASRGEAERFHAVGGLLRRIDPVRRGLSAAVLVRANKTASGLVAFLRQACPEVPVRLEGVGRIDDTPLLPVLLALVRFAFHPGDGLSRGLLATSPLAARLQEMGYEVAASRVRRRIASHGFRACLEEWAAHLPLDDFARHRLAELLLAADRFDLAGHRDADAFVAAMRAHTSRQEGGADAVRVMTVHQAKGLGFDVVVLPELQGWQMDRVEPAVARRWQGCCVGQVHRAFVRFDPVLSAMHEAVRAEAAYEALCLLYVAMTRAKRGLYLVTATPPKSSVVRDYAVLLRHTLGRQALEGGGRPCQLDGIAATELFAAGDPDWYAALPAAADRGQDISSPPAWRPRPVGRGPQPVAPSSAGEERLRVADLLGPAVEARLGLGEAVHHLFERVDWLDEIGDLDRFLDAWRQEAPFSAEILDRAAAHFRRAVAMAEIAAVLQRPSAPVSLWRERAFDVVVAGRRIRGAFDRVEIHGPRERPVAARILDYKTNRLAGEQEIRAACDHYRPQLLLYRQALAALLRLPGERIACTLVFTHCGAVRDLE